MKEPYKVPNRDGEMVVGQIDRQRGRVLLPGNIDDYIDSGGRNWRIWDDQTKSYHLVEFEGKKETPLGRAIRDYEDFLVTLKMLRKMVYDGLQ